MDLGLSGKVALVTGGARDVGREIVLALANEGASVAINYRGSKEAADALVGEIEASGGTDLGRTVLSKSSSVARPEARFKRRL